MRIGLKSNGKKVEIKQVKVDEFKFIKFVALSLKFEMCKSN